MRLRRLTAGLVTIALVLTGAAVGAAAGTVSVAVGTPAPAAAATSVTLDGHGIGHGIGLSQWGAYGYAVDHGWNAAQILNHYYGGTVAGTIPVDTVLPVRLLSLDNRVTTVVSPSGGLIVDGVAGGPWKSVTAQWTGSAYRVYARTTESCAVGGTQVAAAVAGQVTIRTQANTSTTTSYGDLLGVCQSDGSLRAYRGVIVATQSGTRTVNQVPMEQYLRSVIAKEMSPGWSTAGGGQGAQALQAQAVAARSYAFAENRYSPYAKTCDTTACQVYVGAATRASIAAGFVRVEYPSTDAAVVATAGVVRRVGNTAGPVAYTMFAASSGGYTLPGTTALTPFPAVIDEGDDTSKNPYYNWSVTLTGAQISAAYPQIGTFVSITVTSRNGYGDWGGRVLSMKIQGTANSVTLSGDAFKSKFSLKSNWFNVRGSAPLDPCYGRNAPTAGPPLPVSPGARFTPLVGKRLIDTRDGTGTNKAPLLAGCTLVVDPNLSADVTAVVVNLTSVFPATNGFVTAYPCGVARPVASALQPRQGRVVAAAMVVPLGADGTFCLYSIATTNILVDLVGSYSSTAATGSRFEPVDPQRVFDSRSGALLAAGSTVEIDLVGLGVAPADATGAALTLHVFGAGIGGFATAYPCGTTLPEVSSINIIVDGAVSNHAEVGLGNGKVCVFARSPLHLAVDINGWFGPTATTELYTITPERVLDSRIGVGLTGAFEPGIDRELALAGVKGLPNATTLRGLVGVITAVLPPANGTVVIRRCDIPMPDVSMVRFAATLTSAGTVVSADTVGGVSGVPGSWCITTDVAVHVVGDISGYFAEPPST